MKHDFQFVNFFLLFYQLLGSEDGCIIKCKASSPKILLSVSPLSTPVSIVFLRSETNGIGLPSSCILFFVAATSSSYTLELATLSNYTI